MDAPKPRDDVYTLASLLAELDRVLHPLARGSRGQVRVAPSFPPSLPSAFGPGPFGEGPSGAHFGSTQSFRAKAAPEQSESAASAFQPPQRRDTARHAARRPRRVNDATREDHATRHGGAATCVPRTEALDSDPETGGVDCRQERSTAGPTDLVRAAESPKMARGEMRAPGAASAAPASRATRVDTDGRVAPTVPLLQPGQVISSVSPPGDTGETALPAPLAVSLRLALPHDDAPSLRLPSPRDRLANAAASFPSPVEPAAPLRSDRQGGDVQHRDSSPDPPRVAPPSLSDPGSPLARKPPLRMRSWKAQGTPVVLGSEPRSPSVARHASTRAEGAPDSTRTPGERAPEEVNLDELVEDVDLSGAPPPARGLRHALGRRRRSVQLDAQEVERLRRKLEVAFLERALMRNR